MNSPEGLSILRAFAGKGVLLTGSTGFLAKAVAEKILRDLPGVRQIYLLIRARVKADGSRIDPRERLRDEILRNSAFRRLREQLGADFETFCESKLTCVAGDLTAPQLGLDDAAFAALVKNVQIVINSAATVVFDERLDWALNLNTLGPQRLLELAKAANAVYVHISTAYVSGMRTGLVPEKLLDPLEAIDAQLPAGVPRPAKLDVKEEVDKLHALAESVKRDCAKHFQEKSVTPESEEGKAYLRTALVGAGMRRAQGFGWNDTYTFTKFLGEQMIKLNHGPVPTIVVRPSIIESSLREPEPGWLDGLRMADPIIIGFGKGRLSDFPADQHVNLDIIPADLVVNAILTAAAYIQDAGELGQVEPRPASSFTSETCRPQGTVLGATSQGSNTELITSPPKSNKEFEAPFDVICIGTSSENPLSFRALYDYVRAYFQKHPMTDRAGKPVAVPSWKFPTIAQYRRRIKNRYLRPIRAANVVLNSPLPVPGGRRLRARLRTLGNTLEQLLYYVEIYGPYVTLKCQFETKHARELLELLPPEERARFDFDPRKIRWKNYIQDVHIPGLKRNILRMDVVPRTGAGEGHLLDEESEAAKKRRGAAVARGTPQTVVDLSARGAERFGKKMCVEIRRGGTGVTRYSFEELFERSGILARQLIAKLGLHPGDRIALLGENCPEWPLAYMAIARACCAAMPLDRTLPLRDAARLLRLVDAKALVISPALLSAAGDSAANLGLPPCLDLLNELRPHEGSHWPYPEASLGDRTLREPAPEALASLLFTSGTTHDPKGVMLSHANLVADALSVSEVLEPMENDRFLSVLPLHHAFEFTCGCLIPMYGGASVYHLETLRGKEVLDTMKAAEITVVLGVPRLFKMFMDGVQAKIAAAGASGRISVSLGKSAAGMLEFTGDLSARKRIFKKVHDAFGGRLRLFVSGGAALSPEIFEFFQGFGIPVLEGFGLTETGPVLTVNPLHAPRAGSVGPPIPGVEITIHNPDSAGIGEVRARGAVVMQGYWQNPAATQNAFEGGWFKTGDLGRLGKDGYLYITGRLKDVIVTAAGKNVYPDEVETALRGISGVKELCVIGLPSRTGMGEEVAAVAVLEPGSSQAAVAAAIERACEGLPSHQRVARVEFQSEDLPKTSTLKIQRNKVRERLTHSPLAPERGEGSGERDEQRTDNPSPLAPLPAIAGRGEVFSEVARAIAKIAQNKPSLDEIRPDAKLLMDFGIDSIGIIELLAELEGRLDLSLPRDVESKLFTVRDVVTVAEAAQKAGAKRRGKPANVRGRLEPLPERLENVRAGMRSSFSKTMLQGAFSTTASVFMKTYLRVDCTGLEHIPASGAYILAANHCSHLDTVAIREVLGKRAAGLHVMGARDYFFDTRLKSWFFTTFLNALPFDREENIGESLAVCRTVLENSRAILIFPEGTRSLSGELQPFKPGIGVLGLDLSAPVIPLYLKGTFESLPKGRALPRPARIEVTIGAAADFEALKQLRGEMPASELYRRAAGELRARIEALAG